MSITWAVVGAVTPTTAKVSAKSTTGSVKVHYDTTPNVTTSSPVTGTVATVGGAGICSLSGLTANTRYWFAAHDTVSLDTLHTGTFKTFPVAGSIADFEFAVSSCAGAGTPQYPGVGAVLASGQLSNHLIFEKIHTYYEPLFFVHQGDMHYYDLGSGLHGIVGGNTVANYRRAWDDVFLQPRQETLYRSTPLVYSWDDHDYGPNDSDGTLANKANAAQVYREVFPTYTLPDAASIYHSFEVGRVLFIVSDTRYNRSPDTDPDTAAKTMLGAAQKTWLAGVLNASTAQALVWLMPTPWMGRASDTWSGFQTEQAELVTILNNNGGWLDRTVMVNGDNHMLALDDGGGNISSTIYGGGGGFPVYTAGSLDSPDLTADDVSYQYNSGPTLPGANQWCRFLVKDYGHRIDITGMGQIGGFNTYHQHTLSVATSTPLVTTFPAGIAPWKVEIAPGANPADPDTWDPLWVDISSDVRYTDGITISNGRADEWGETGPASCTLTLNNRSGNYSPRNPTGIYYGQLSRNTPLRVRWDDGSSVSTRFVGFVPSWPQRWDTSGNDAFVPVEAGGQLRRLSQGTKALRGVLYRRISAIGTGPFFAFPPARAYWPLEDGIGTTLAGSPIPGVEPMRVTGFTFEADSDLPSSGPLPTMTVGSSYSGDVPSWSNPTGWRVEFVYNMAEAPNVNNLIFIRTSGSAKRWELSIQNSVIRLIAIDSDGTELANVSSTPPDFFGAWSRAYVTARQNGGNVEFVFAWFIIDSAGHFNTSSFAGTVGAVTNVGLSQRGTGASDVSIGHISVWDDPDADWYLGSEGGFTQDPAGVRFSRLALEEDIPSSYVGEGPVTPFTTSTMMGPQGIDTYVNLSRDAEASDGGLLFDLDGGLAMKLRNNFFNQSVSLTLDSAAGEIMPAREPTDDDQQLRNDVTVSRRDGSRERFFDQASIDLEGTYDEEVDLSLFTDAVLPSEAAWRVHLGTVDEMRWPRIRMNLAKDPHLIQDWMNFQLGGRVVVNTPIEGMPGIGVDVLAMGYTERFTQVTWDVELNCVPAKPWMVAELDSDTLGRVDTDGSALTAALAAPSAALNTNTGFEVNTTDWVGSAAAIARDTSQHHSGVASVKVTPSGGVTASLDRTAGGVVSVTAGKVYTFIGWVYSPTGWPSIGMSFLWRNGGATVKTTDGPTMAIPAATWTRLSMSMVAPLSGVDALLVRVRQPGAPAASDVWYADDLTVLVDSALTVATVEDGPDWTTTAAEFPFDVMVSGEEMTVLDVDFAGPGTPTFISAGTSSTANNAAVTPGLPASVVAGDLVLIAASIRTTSGTVTTPAGWTTLLSIANFKVMGRVYDGLWTMPSVTFAGGAAGDDTIGQSCAFRGVQMGGITNGGLTNGSAQNIAFPSRSPRLDQPLVLYAGWKQDDWTSVDTPLGFTEIGEQVATAGNDSGQVWGYRIGRPQPQLNAGSLVVTGGAAAVSKGFTFAFQRSDQILTVVRSVNGVVKSHAVGTDVRLAQPMILSL